jgi:hypothetical protein
MRVLVAAHRHLGLVIGTTAIASRIWKTTAFPIDQVALLL